MSELTLLAIEQLFDRKFDEKFDEKFDKKFDEKFDQRLAIFATKEDLKGLATKDDLSWFASKDDLTSEIRPIKLQLTSIEEKIDRLSVRANEDHMANAKDISRLKKIWKSMQD